MADSRGDAPGKSRGTATGDKPERPNARGRNRQTGASSDQSASASTTMSANVGALLRLCESVLPPGLCAAASNGTHKLPSLAAISDRYRDHLRANRVTARDAPPCREMRGRCQGRANLTDKPVATNLPSSWEYQPSVRPWKWLSASMLALC